jgi:hypothetical protein
LQDIIVSGGKEEEPQLIELPVTTVLILAGCMQCQVHIGTLFLKSVKLLTVWDHNKNMNYTGFIVTVNT